MPNSTTNATYAPTFSPTIHPINEYSINTTPENTITPTTLPTQEPTLTDTIITNTTSSPTSRVEIIRLPTYSSKDPIDGVFFIFSGMLLLTFGIALAHTFVRFTQQNKSNVNQRIKKRDYNDDTGDAI